MSAPQNLFISSPALLDTAIAQEKAGTLDTWRDTVGAALGYVGDHVATFAEHYNAAKAAGALKLAKAAADKRLKGFTTPDSIVSLCLGIMNDHDDNGADTPASVSVTFSATFNAEGNVVVTPSWNTSKPRSARSSGGSVASGSNISAWVAYQRGIKGGDPADITKVRPKVYATPNGEVGKGCERSLLQYFRDNPVIYSNTADVLRQYGKMD